MNCGEAAIHYKYIIKNQNKLQQRAELALISRLENLKTFLETNVTIIVRNCFLLFIISCKFKQSKKKD